MSRKDQIRGLVSGIYGYCYFGTSGLSLRSSLWPLGDFCRLHPHLRRNEAVHPIVTQVDTLVSILHTVTRFPSLRCVFFSVLLPTNQPCQHLLELKKDDYKRQSLQLNPSAERLYINACSVARSGSNHTEPLVLENIGAYLKR